MSGRIGWWCLALVVMPLALACSSDGGGGGSLVCSPEQPVECHENGVVVGCCPADLPVCSPNACLPQGGESGQSGGGGQGGASGGSGGFGGGPGGTGGFSASGGLSGSGGGGTGGGGFGGGPTGGTGGTPTGGTGGGPTCTDPGFEPNDNEGSATNLGTIDDCDGSGSAVSGKLDGNQDADFYVYSGTDEYGCAVDPTATTAAPVRLCVFATCIAGGTVTCSQGTQAQSPAGYSGCCAFSGGSVKIGVNCSGLSDDATVYLRVDQPNGTSCTPYTIDFHY